MAGDIAFPNGMVVTPDNRTLIIAESFTGTLTAFDIAEDGQLSNRRVFADGLGPDGICIDADGAGWTSRGDKTAYEWPKAATSSTASTVLVTDAPAPHVGRP